MADPASFITPIQGRHVGLLDLRFDPEENGRRQVSMRALK
jgi:hypothetical protein